MLLRHRLTNVRLVLLLWKRGLFHIRCWAICIRRSTRLTHSVEHRSWIVDSINLDHYYFFFCHSVSGALSETTVATSTRSAYSSRGIATPDIGGIANPGSIDLLIALQLHNTTRQGVTRVPGLVTIKPAYYLQGELTLFIHKIVQF